MADAGSAAARRWAMVLAVALCLVVFVDLAAVVHLRVLVPGDAGMRRWAYEHRLRRLFLAGIDLDNLIEPPHQAVLDVLVVAAVAWRRRQVWPVLYGALLLSLLAAAVLGIKTLVARPNVSGVILASSHGGSFPSGHTVSTVVSGALLVTLLGLERRAWAWVVVYLAAGAVGLTLIYTGAHWLSDVLAGLLMGGAISLVGLLVLGPLRDGPDPA